MKNLFAYGSLMCEDIMVEVSGCRLPFESGKINGYSRRSVRGEHYPALVPDDSGCVEGIVYLDVPQSAWERLDRFEGKMYIRQAVNIELTDGRMLPGLAYVVRPEYVEHLESDEWDFENFLKNGKAHFQREYRGYQQL